MKVLIADDHIPDENVLGDEIKQFVEQKYPSESSPELIERFTFMRKMINRLRDAGFDIYVCNHASLTKKIIRKNKYDAAIIDLGWYADYELPVNDRPFHGWKIIDIIKKESPLLPMIMYSNRLFERAEIPITAAEKGVLPVYKDFKDTCVENLIAVLKILHSTRVQVKTIDTNTYKTLSIIATVMVAVVPVFIIVGLVLLLLDKTDVGLLTGGLNLIIAAFSSIFWKYLDNVRKNILL